MANDSSDTDALLKDLESRASSSKSATAPKGDGGGDEDIEAFLRSLEGDDYVPPPKEAEKKATPTQKAAPAKKAVKTKSKDDLDARFGALEEAPDAPLEKVKKKEAAAKKPAEKKESRKERKAREKAEKAAAKEAETALATSDGSPEAEGTRLRNFVRFLKVVGFVVPSVLACWLIGAYLGAWVSASWLIAALAIVVVFGAPLALLLATKRGRYVFWSMGVSTIFVVTLVAPMTGSAQKALEAHGHWPGTAFAQALGASPDHVLVRATASVASFIGQLVHPVPPTELSGPRKLGSDTDPLNPPPVDPNAPPVNPVAPPVDPNAPVQPAPQPNPAPTQPAPQPQPNPAPVHPAPQPQPNPAPVQPAPQPQPNPAPVQPSPDPAPTQPAPVKPNPDPTQPQPNPAQPTPQPSEQPTPQPSEQPAPSP